MAGFCRDCLSDNEDGGSGAGESDEGNRPSRCSHCGSLDEFTSAGIGYVLNFRTAAGVAIGDAAMEALGTERVKS